MCSSKLYYQQIFLLLFILFFSPFYSFSQIDENPTSSGESDTCFVNFEEFETNCLCVLPNSFVVLDSDYLLKDLIKQNSENPNCDNYYPENIDMDKEVIIGLGIRSGGCGPPKVNISVYKIDSLKKIECNINVIRRGNCLAMFNRIIWIKFDKQPEKFTINVVDNRNKLIYRKSCFE